jgi:hypothetical protein
MADPKHPRHKELKEWNCGIIFNPDFFDLELLNEDLGVEYSPSPTKRTKKKAAKK